MRGLLLLALLLAALSKASCRRPVSQPGTVTDLTTHRTLRLGWPILRLSLIAHTREGSVRGRTARSAGGHLFFSFKGIPYARPPTRFQPPERHPGWQGLRNAFQHGRKCLQWERQELVGAEDCLFANVYTPLLPGPATSTIVRLPVMVYIHGGGFITGHSGGDDVGARYFMDEDIVLVTFNYRLGPLGFYTTHDVHAPGNYGLRDQLLMLQWVQDNIAAFGGDPRSVTIFGNSAGAASVSLLVLSPLAKGLFHHAISQSGSAISSFAASGRRKGLARRFAVELGCSGDDSAAFVQCARDASAKDLMDVSRRIRSNEIHTDSRFLPRVDDETAHPFLPRDPRELLQLGQFNLVPWMSGLTEEEGIYFVRLVPSDEVILAALYAGDLLLWSQLADLTSRSETSIVDCDAHPIEETHRIYHFLIGRFGTASADNPLPFVRLISDRIFVTGTSAEIELASAYAPVYKYVVDHRGPGRLEYHAPVPGLYDVGVKHGDELAYMFNREGQPLQQPGSAAHTMIRFFVTLWTSFARTGRPSSRVLPTPDWPIYSDQVRAHMRLNSEPTVDTRLFEDWVDFWQTVRINEPWRHPFEECDPAPTKAFKPTSVGNVTFAFSLE